MSSSYFAKEHYIFRLMWNKLMINKESRHHRQKQEASIRDTTSAQWNSVNFFFKRNFCAERSARVLLGGFEGIPLTIITMRCKFMKMYHANTNISENKINYKNKYWFSNQPMIMIGMNTTLPMKIISVSTLETSGCKIKDLDTKIQHTFIRRKNKI